MDFAFSEEQEELRRYVRQWLDDKSSSEDVRAQMATSEGIDAARWSEIGSLGWQAMAIPEDLGGVGYGFLETAVVLEEQGRSLFVGPFLSTVVLAANAILRAGSDEQQKAHLPAIAAGEVVATVAVSDATGAMSMDGVETTATPDGDEWILSGTKRFVLDGHVADLVVVVAHGPDGPEAFLVDGTEPNSSLLPTMDETRKQAEVELDGVRVSDSARLTGDIAGMVRHLDRLGSVALALESVGAAARCLEMSVEYAKERKQFGRPIGSFQAIKHKCADMVVAVEAARSAAHYAAWTVAEESEDVERAAVIAAAHCTDAFFHCASETIQIHGGIGFTWEHDAHLYFKRAKSSQLMFGSPQDHRRRFAELIGL